ncbi:2-oxoacid:acceptor oxidoreductase family protein [Myxococcota bacterium]|nr:2-oxoacid:acceptor oxidoreductase family protein [Myxococcota bacterium]MBU1536356.1 2-oxoacid:acceptor oxidoreductase family protein [Myxococcota bacterium]
MEREVTFAGFGGQGVMTAGKFLAQGAMNKGMEVAWVPSYGPEMRGGTAYCTVVIADEPVGSPIVRNPETAVVMNRPSLDKFGPEVKSGGCLIINSSLIDVTSDRDDILVVLIPCNQISMEVVGTGRSANMAALGAYAGAVPVVDYQSIEAVVKSKFSKKPKVLEDNLSIMQKGYELGRQAREAYEAGKRG